MQKEGAHISHPKHAALVQFLYTVNEYTYQNHYCILGFKTLMTLNGIINYKSAFFFVFGGI